MPSENVDARLMEMLNATRPETAERPPRARAAAREEARRDSGFVRVPGTNIEAAPGGAIRPVADDPIYYGSPEWCREHPGECTGRGPTGRLRNFRAMNITKLVTTRDSVSLEANDQEALDAINAEIAGRGL